MRLWKCWFCSSTIYPGHGIHFVRNDARIFRFCRSKCHRNFQIKKNPRKVFWTKAYRRLHGKDMTKDSTFEFERKRNRPERYDRNTFEDTLKAIPKILKERAARQDRHIKKRMKKKKAMVMTSMERMIMAEERKERPDEYMLKGLGAEKDAYLKYLLEVEGGSFVIFVDKVSKCHHLKNLLYELGVKTMVYYSKLSKHHKGSVRTEFEADDRAVLIATQYAQVPSARVIIEYDIPRNECLGLWRKEQKPLILHHLYGLCFLPFHIHSIAICKSKDCG